MTQLVLEILEGRDAGIQVQLSGPIVAGRDAGLSLRLDDTAVSEQHARFSIERGAAWVEDLRSADGTYVNELQVIGRSMIRPGDRIRLGMSVLVLLTEHQANGDRRRPRQPRVPELAVTVLEHVSDDELASRYEPNAVPPLRVEETAPAFLEAAVPRRSGPEGRFGALDAWTDSRVKHQTKLAAFGLLTVAALAVLLLFFH